MQIYVHSRSFFEARQGTKRERKLFRDNRIISINSVSFPSEEPPFSEEFLDAENLLILYFDDVDEGFPNAMTPEQAREIVNFVRHEDNRPIIVHCTAGISRSGAVGEVLNWYFNRYLEDNPPVYRLNEIMNRDIVPNSHVRRLLLAELQRNHEKLRGMVKTIRMRYWKKRLKNLLSGAYAEKIYSDHPQLEAWFKKFNCVSFSEKVICGNPEVTKLARDKFLHSRCGVTSFNGKVLVTDLKGDGKMFEIFDKMLQMATPETYAVKEENHQDFFTPFKEYFKSRIYDHSKMFLRLFENDPRQAAIMLLVNTQFDFVNMFSKHASWHHAQKFDCLYEQFQQQQ